MLKHVARRILAFAALPLSTSGALAADPYIGAWVAATDPANRIEIKLVDGQYQVEGREAVIYAGKPTEYRPKIYKAALQSDGALRIAFFTSQTFKIDGRSGNLKSQRSEYHRATP